jgi:hypothetical protein
MSGKPIKVTCNDDKINYPMKPIKDPTENDCYAPGIAGTAWHGLAWPDIGALFPSFTSLLISFIIIKKRRRSRNSDDDDDDDDDDDRNSDSSWCCSIILLLVQLVLWTLSLITGSVFAWLWVNNGPTETLAPNFLAACQPQGLDLLCSPDSSHPEDWNPVVWVTCTTPPEMWIPALSNALPLLAAVQAYLTFAAIIYIIYNWKCEHTVLKLCFLALSIISFGVVAYKVISDNVASPSRIYSHTVLRN